jgi:hypothetical protein
MDSDVTAGCEQDAGTEAAFTLCTIPVDDALVQEWRQQQCNISTN